ncbi:MFS monosaccharide transporter-like protein [Xylaria bambusicola]|uniref:MFS monosaccharide transporter-like protein n=1 Tax=Xylaria bambusicola TaxID=326684 RepID=UPI002007B9C8|nr:MFS monosaccharide transporter-like protein [Xylaria bambusicola]KAI0508901.1 MFS monosaccharide transporter-like protein [Xylaria bambusicola]
MAENRLKDHELGMREHWKALLIITLVSLSSFQYGLDFGIIGGLQAMIGFLQIFGERAPSTPLGWNINAERQQLISSLMVLGAFISSSTAGFTAKYFGRKMSLWIACVGVFVSTALMQATTQIGGLYAGRLIIGLSNGLLMTHAQLYIQECSPGRYRGFGISIFTYWVAVGSLIGTVIDNFASKINSRNAYIIPLGIVHVIPLILTQVIDTPLIQLPDSYEIGKSLKLDANSVVHKGRMDEAERALRRLRPAGWSVMDELEEMATTLAAEARLQSSIGYRTLFQNPIDRRRTFLSVFGLTTQAASGAMFVISYGTYFFEMANVGNAFENSCILTGTGVAALLFNALVITKYGRRRVMMTSGFIVCGLSQLIMAIVYTIEPGTEKTGKVIVGLSVIYIVAYNALISTYAWLSGGELASQRLRSHTFGLATAIGFFGAWLTTFTAPYFINPTQLNWGPKYGYIWTGSCAVAGAWVWLYLPEVKGRTLEQIDEMFEAGVPARKFRKYQCTRRVDDEKPQVDHVESQSSQEDGSEPKVVANVSTSKI